jgi:molybdate transport system ATP-binding protein
MISFERVSWSAGEFTLALDLKLSERVTGIFGASGSGKTSLLEVVAGLRKPQTGAVSCAGVNYSEAGTGFWLPPEQRKLGYVPQDAALFPHLSVEENIRYGERRSESGTEPQFHFTDIVALLGLGALLPASAGGLSGGERQRVALARALVSQATLLLLDEPLASVEQGRRESVLHYLRMIRDDLAVPMLYVSHSAEEMVTLCEEILILEHGRLCTRGKPNEVFSKETVVRYVQRRGRP